MNNLVSRKRLLIAESELNRSQLTGDLVALSVGVRALAGRAKSWSSIGSSALVLLLGLGSLRRPTGVAEAKSSWLKKLFKGISIASTLWFTFRSKVPDRQ